MLKHGKTSFVTKTLSNRCSLGKKSYFFGHCQTTGIDTVVLLYLVLWLNTFCPHSVFLNKVTH